MTEAVEAVDNNCLAVVVTYNPDITALIQDGIQLLIEKFFTIVGG